MVHRVRRLQTSRTQRVDIVSGRFGPAVGPHPVACCLLKATSLQWRCPLGRNDLEQGSRVDPLARVQVSNIRLLEREIPHNFAQLAVPGFARGPLAATL